MRWSGSELADFDVDADADLGREGGGGFSNGCQEGSGASGPAVDCCPYPVGVIRRGRQKQL